LSKQIALLLLLVGLLSAQVSSPERKVQGNVITSERDPAIRIHLPKSAEYVGADRWVLFGIADCELHAFVDADAQKNVKRLYWVQFEGYVPSRPELKHTYDSPRHAFIGGLDFYVDTWVRNVDSEVEPGSDVEHVRALIRGKGYHMPEGMVSVHLVHLLDETKRKELMLIYSEEVKPTGLSASDLQPEGKAHDQWQSIEKGLIERAENAIAIEQRR
jgi:hypothetical protein